MILVVFSPHHDSSAPLSVNLGAHTLVIARENTPLSVALGLAPDAKITPAKASFFNNEEAYKLCVCLETLFAQKEDNDSTSR